MLGIHLVVKPFNIWNVVGVNELRDFKICGSHVRHSGLCLDLQRISVVTVTQGTLDRTARKFKTFNWPKTLWRTRPIVLIAWKTKRTSTHSKASSPALSIISSIVVKPGLGKACHPAYNHPWLKDPLQPYVYHKI